MRRLLTVYRRMGHVGVVCGPLTLVVFVPPLWPRGHWWRDRVGDTTILRLGFLEIVWRRA